MPSEEDRATLEELLRLAFGYLEHLPRTQAFDISSLREPYFDALNARRALSEGPISLALAQDTDDLALAQSGLLGKELELKVEILRYAINQATWLQTKPAVRRALTAIATVIGSLATALGLGHAWDELLALSTQLLQLRVHTS